MIATVIAFALELSLTLAAAPLGFVQVPGPPEEALIALSIVFVAAEIVRARQGRPGMTLLFIAAVLALIADGRRALRRLAWAQPAWLGQVVPYVIGSLASFWMIQRMAAF